MSERDFIGYGDERPDVAWPGDALLALSIVVNFEEGAERTPLYGDAECDPMSEAFAAVTGGRDLRIESLFEYGTRRGFWRLSDIFEESKVRVSFNACGVALERSPELASEITERGHEVLGHGRRWIPVHGLSREAEAEEIRAAVSALERLSGQRPVGWNTRGGPSLHTRALLIETGGFLYDSESYSEDLPYWLIVNGERWLTIPYTLDQNDTTFWRAPGYGAPEDFTQDLRAALDLLYEEAKESPRLMTVGLHMRHAGRPAGAQAVEDFITYASGFERIWIARRRDIADWWWQEYQGLEPMKS
jgi:peptidoglycan/xylan/chitin deacetylase (PgdA/CDA1 family)